METPKGHDRKFLVCMYEFLGQIFFMYAAQVSGGTGSDAWGITGPLALFAVINIFGGVSGGHFNPAVTLGVYVREQKWAENFIFMVMIIASQLGGALVGMLLSYLVLRVQQDGDYTVLAQNVPLLLPTPITANGQCLLKQPANCDTIGETDAAGVTTYPYTNDLELSETWTTFYMEVICTFIFVLFILHATGKHTVGPDMGVWGVPAICLVLWGLCSVDYFTGASFNPALALGITFFQAWQRYSPMGVMTYYLPMYMGGAALGGILAGVFYNWHSTLFHEEHDDENEHNNASVQQEKYAQ